MTDNYSEINDELLALRAVLQEDESNESNIIRDLKMYLIAKNISDSEINDIIFNFYQSFNINLSNEFITSINPVPNLLDNSLTSFLLNPSSFLNNNQQNDDSDESDNGDDDETDNGDDDETDNGDDDETDSDDDDYLIEEANNINEDDIIDEDNDIVEEANNIEENNDEGNEDNNQNQFINVIEEANMLNPNNNIISVMNDLHQLNNMLSTINNQNGPILNGNPNNIFNFNILNQQSNADNLPNVQTNPSEFLNILGDLISTVNNNSDMEDVKVTLDDNDLKKLESNELTEDLNEKCSICMMEMKKGEKYTKLSCNHGFHTDCVMQWFKEYNYKCPVCRKECGNAKYHV